MTWRDTLDQRRADVEHVLLALTDVLGQLAPWAVMAPVAALSYDSAHTVLGLSPAIAGIAAGGVECLGLYTTDVALRMLAYNARRHTGDDPDPRAPSEYGIGVAASYFLATTGMTALLVAQGRNGAILMWPVLAIVSTVARALLQDQARRETLARTAAERRRARETKRQNAADKRAHELELARVQAESVQSVTDSATSCTPATVDSKPDTRTAVLDYLSAHPDAPNNEIVHELTADGYGRTAVYGAIHKVRQNGHAVTA